MLTLFQMKCEILYQTFRLAQYGFQALAVAYPCTLHLQLTVVYYLLFD